MPCRTLVELRAKAALAAILAAGLRAGQAYARAYEAAKRRAGAVDFDDLIRHVAHLLAEPGMGDWVRYKLDRETDHILIDEAQDTNVDQWSIVAALASEYFAGAGAKGEHRLRTIFTVGDFKQAIFGFQGTSPEAFRIAQDRFRARADESQRPFTDLGLDRSFRSTPPVLAVVDRMLADLGPEALGLDRSAPPHRATPSKSRLPGAVTIFGPTAAELEAEIDDEGEEGWVDSAVRAHAKRIARQVKAWLDEGLPLAGQRRALRPEDIMILARKRGELVPLIVARLHAEGVPVAGVDRLRLTAPLAVRDLLAAMRFALQPADDLNLANLLVSPLIGLTQDALFAIAHKRRGSLWDAVRDRDATGIAEALAAILARADYTTPYRFLEELLSGALDGRRKLLARLGAEARDPIDELVGAALQFEGEATPTLQRFVDWFDRGEVEITRDPAAPLDAVRVMTVHGSKGLQAPLVILADAAADPDAAPASSVALTVADGVSVPIFRLRKDEAHGPLADAIAAVKDAGQQEHWRLLYVAATRAEERLVVTGALGSRAKGVPPEASWYAALDRALAGMGAEKCDDPLWGWRRDYVGAGAAHSAAPRAARPASPLVAAPAWLRTPAPVEQRPPRPLAPSAIGQDRVADPPPDAAMRAAARRGELLHALFERLPRIAPEARAAAADRWLRDGGGVEEADARHLLTDDACAILADPRFAAIFHPDALAEAPLAAIVEGEVVAGTVDRLLVEPDRVLVVDFKTGRRAPATLDQVPDHHLDQMGAYAAALAAIFPGRRIEAALLYTSGPNLIPLPADLLAARKPGYARAEQSLAAGR